jgi:glycosyltransferase involved in cell wall biosynthesis
MDLPDDVEIVFVDDGSDPALRPEFLKNFSMYYTNCFTPWTQPAARNFGVKRANGEYLIVTDIDHIISRELIEFVRKTEYDFVRFRREFGVIDEAGKFDQSQKSLMDYGITEERLIKKGAKLVPHTNSFAIKRDLYESIGGVSERHVGSGKHPNREEQPLKSRIKKLVSMGQITTCPDDERPLIYMIPNGRFCGDKDYNPFKLFHNLERMSR